MIGVVLWRDANVGKAVIWCEDQGDLAFYTGLSSAGTFDICVGDWVAFGLELHGSIRVAVKVRVLAEPSCPELVQDLVASSEMLETWQEQEQEPGTDRKSSRPGASDAAERFLVGSHRNSSAKISDGPEPAVSKHDKTDDKKSDTNQAVAIGALAVERAVSSVEGGLAKTNPKPDAGCGVDNIILFPSGKNGDRRSA